MTKVQGYAQRGGASVTVSGTIATISQGTSNRTQVSYPNCTVTVYYAGGVIVPGTDVFSDEIGTVKGNPFTAATDGYWFFYIADGDYDIRFSGAGISAPFTLGDISVGSSGSIVTNVKSAPYNAKGNGVTDDTIAFQSAIDATYAVGGGTVFIPPGTYLLGIKTAGTYLLRPKSSVRIIGSGPRTILTVPAGFTDWDMFRTDSDTNDLYFADFAYDGNGLNNLVDAFQRLHTLLYLQFGKRLTVRNVTCHNVAGQRCMSIGSAGPSSGYTDVLIEGCCFYNVADDIIGNVLQTDHSCIWTNASGYVENSNIFSNASVSAVATAIETHGRNLVVSNNSIRNFNLGVIAAAVYDDHENAIYSNNPMMNVNGGYRTYFKAGKIFDCVINGGAIEQTGELYPIIDLDQGDGFANEIQVSNILLVNNKAIPITGNAFGVALGRVKHLKLSNITMKNVASRGITIGTTVGIATNESKLVINDVVMIDCGRTTAAGTYATGIALFSANTLLYLAIDGCTFINTVPGAPMLEAIRGNAPVASHFTRNNRAINVTTLWNYAAIEPPALGAIPSTTDISTVLHDLGLVT
jgi:hypothetical protein